METAVDSSLVQGDVQRHNLIMIAKKLRFDEALQCGRRSVELFESLWTTVIAHRVGLVDDKLVKFDWASKMILTSPPTDGGGACRHGGTGAELGLCKNTGVVRLLSRSWTFCERAIWSG